MEQNSIGKNIRKYRLEKNMKQDQLAEKAGLSPNYIGMVERGEKVPSLYSFISIVNSLEVTADMILCDELNRGYEIKNSLLNEKISELAGKDQRTVYAVLNSLLEIL